MDLKNPDRRIFFKLEYEDVYEEAILALEDCGFEIRKADKSSGSIMVTASMSFQSWGETIEVSVSVIDEGVEVVAQSKPKMPTQIIGWGINKKNVSYFFSALMRRARIKKTILDEREAVEKREKLFLPMGIKFTIECAFAGSVLQKEKEINKNMY